MLNALPAFLAAVVLALLVATDATLLTRDLAVFEVFLTWISNALVGLMAWSSPNSSVDQMGALTVQEDGSEPGI